MTHLICYIDKLINKYSASVPKSGAQIHSYFTVNHTYEEKKVRSDRHQIQGLK
jgi:hypothetical protein